MFENIQRGTYQVGDKTVYFRSKWEYEYACYLEWLVRQNQIAGWWYEYYTFEFPIKHGTTRYMPDFRVLVKENIVEWHEVKGFLTSKAKTQINRFRKYYPKEKLIIIDKEWFKSVKDKKQLWLKSPQPFSAKLKMAK